MASLAGIAEPIIADLGEIHSILLDHGARCESEVKMIVRELEVKRGDRERQHLTIAVDEVTRGTTIYGPAVTKACEEVLPPLTTLAVDVTQQTQAIRALAAKFEADRESLRKDRQAARLQAAQRFSQSLETKRTAFLAECEEVEKRIQEVAASIQEAVAAAPSRIDDAAKPDHPTAPLATDAPDADAAGPAEVVGDAEPTSTEAAAAPAPESAPEAAPSDGAAVSEPSAAD